MVSNGRMTHRTGRSPRPSPAISHVFKVPVDRLREASRTEEDEITGDDADIETLRELFFGRLERVWRLVKASRPKAGVSPNDAQHRFHANHLRKLAAQKPHTHRQMVGVSTKKFMKYRQHSEPDIRRANRDLHSQHEKTHRQGTKGLAQPSRHVGSDGPRRSELR